MHVSDVLMHVDPGIRVLGENPFELPFFPPDMHEEKKEVVLFPPDMREEDKDPVLFLPDMREEKKNVVVSRPEVHLLAILYAFSTLVLKRRTAVCKSAGIVHDNVRDVLLKAGVEKGAEGDDSGAGIHVHPAVRVIPGEMRDVWGDGKASSRSLAMLGTTK